MSTTTRKLQMLADPWLPHLARIEQITHEAPSISTYDLRFENTEISEGFRFAPGQFNMLYLPGFGEAAISVSSNPQFLKTISHTIRFAGNVTRAIARLPVGGQIAVRGPFGSAWPVQACRGRDVIIACGGVGLAPLRPALYHIIDHRDEFGRVHLLYGARTPSNLLYTGEYNSWREADIEVNITVDLGESSWQGHIGVVPMLFDRLRLDAPNTHVLTCGPEIMMRFVIFEALARKISAQHIYLSMERNMNCALGFCGHCQLGPAFVCKDGPVFSYEQMEPYMHLEDF